MIVALNSSFLNLIFNFKPPCPLSDFCFYFLLIATSYPPLGLPLLCLLIALLVPNIEFLLLSSSFRKYSLSLSTLILKFQIAPNISFSLLLNPATFQSIIFENSSRLSLFVFDNNIFPSSYSFNSYN